MSQGVDALIKLPILLICVILSWPLSVFVGIHNLFRSLESRHSVIDAAERYTANRNSKRLSILAAQNGHSVSVVAAKDSVEDTSSDECQEIYSSVPPEPSVWQAGNREYALFGQPSQMSIRKDPLKSKASETRKRGRSSAGLEVVQEHCDEASDEAKKWLRDSELGPSGGKGTFSFEVPRSEHIPTRRKSIGERTILAGEPGSSTTPLIPITRSSTRLTTTEESAAHSAKLKTSMRFRSNISLRNAFKKAGEPPQSLPVEATRSIHFSTLSARLKYIIPKRLLHRTKTQTEESSSRSAINRLSIKAKERFSTKSGASRASVQAD